MPQTLSKKSTGANLGAWTNAIGALVDQIENWATQRRWAVNRGQKKISERDFGEYAVPVLSVLAPAGQLQVDPVARYVVGADGRVDLLGWPSMNRMVLVRVGGKWILKTDSGLRWPERWSQKTLENLVKLLNADR